MTITDPAVSAHADATIGLFEITDHITIDSTQGAHTVEMWCPVIGDGAFQTRSGRRGDQRGSL